MFTNGPGNGSVDLNVDGYGSFGFALDDTPSPDLPGASSFQTADGRTTDVGPYSATFIGFGAERDALTSGDLFGNGGLPAVAVTNDNGTAVSSFMLPSAGPGQPVLQFNLRQSLQPLFSGIARTGTILVQEYFITNQSAFNAEFNTVRFFDADLAFDASSVEGGGVLTLQGDDFVIITELADTVSGTIGTTSTGSLAAFTGLDANNDGVNGVVAGSSVYIIDRESDVLDTILDGLALSNGILDNVGGFVDPGSATNLAIAYGSSYILTPGGSTTFTARTLFGSGAPTAATPNPPPPPPQPAPAPASILLMLLGLLGLRKLHKA